MEAKMLLENLVIKYKTDEKIIQSLLQFFMIVAPTKQKYRGEE
jgi:hypothetical protein